MNKMTFLAVSSLAVLLSVSAPAMAADDHGHDHDRDHGSQSAAGSPASPRFALVSNAFELVVKVDGRQLTVYLDRYEDNAPVEGASVELDVGGTKVALVPSTVGEFEGTLASDLAPGVVSVVASVTAGTEAELLAGEFRFSEPATESGPGKQGWRRYLGWAAGLVALVVIGWASIAIARRRRAAVVDRAEGAA